MPDEERDLNDTESIENEASGIDESSTESANEIEDIISSNDQENIHRDPMPVIGEEGAKKRDQKYTELFEDFVKNYDIEKKQTLKFKKDFFGIVIALFFVLGISGVVLLFLALFVKTENALPIVISSSVEILASFIAIPTIIAKHLFPEKIDGQIVEIAKVLMENDSEVRKFIEKRREQDSTSEVGNIKNITHKKNHG